MKPEAKGFTLIELLIVVAIIGIIAALLIPNFLDALQKSKQKKSVADVRITGTAMFSWLTDQVSAAAAGQNVTQVTAADYPVIGQDALTDLLVPNYIQVVPPIDGWKNPFDYRLNTADPHAEQVMMARSPGRYGAFSGDLYEVQGFDPTDYDQDIVWADGFFVRWPQGQ
jgi:prepilin-type N-terminal cleavage/methylation domain-containing protein